ncbi:carbohydrate ABC transporter permease [Paenibacillus oryzisoli]|uniref:ABC transporter permease n=1 Tax=Paenibacillus oryzisoli TaxID=1850517 RepID=A0A198A9N3_9BACL|nr:carbohydrate ABC transporter permease [Paenibacillus oryzisoli]OAS17877.1 ABC transporter permease [Paenibacillus oryzisoli]
MIYSKGEKAFGWLNYMCLSLLGLSMLLPFIHLLAKALSDESYVLAHEITFWPKGMHFDSFAYVLNNQQFIKTFGNSVFITLVGTLLSLLITMLAAYPLSKAGFPGRRFILFLYVLTMFFSGGIIPTYLVVKGIGMTNTIWSMIIPTLVAPFNLILMRSFFMGIPDALDESAKIDGASNTRILFSIYVPLSMSSIATISMFYAVGYWNNFFSAMLYITDRNLMPLQVYLMSIIQDENNVSMSNVEALMNSAPESIRAATIIAAVVPILLIYPFLQKYFVKGALVGAVKE